MKLQVVSIRDRAIDAFGRPAFVPALGAAVRGFGDEINRAGSEMNAHPDDYDLYHLGEWDDATGEFTQLKRPEQIAVGKNMKGAGA